MPPVFSNVVDQVGAELLQKWIAALPASPVKFVRDWTVKDLLPKLDAARRKSSPFPAARSESAERTYKKLGCIQCHRLNEEGGGAGPDLTTVGARLSPAQILTSIVAPSERISPEYAATLIVTTDGRVFEGRIEAETESTIRLRSSESLAPATTLLKSEVEERSASSRSMMPSGMLNSCTESEAIDLLIYLSNTGARSSANQN